MESTVILHGSGNTDKKTEASCVPTENIAFSNIFNWLDPEMQTLSSKCREPTVAKMPSLRELF